MKKQIQLKARKKFFGEKANYTRFDWLLFIFITIVVILLVLITSL